MRLRDIAAQVGINYDYLISLVTYSEKFYNTYYIKKSAGKHRTIDSPNYEIKAVQGWISKKILEKIPISDRAYGFVKNRGVKTNAKNHLGSKYIMCLDIKDFFHSIGIDKVKQIFRDIPYDDFLSNQLAKLCTYKGRLPQGGVTSPVISNIVFKPIDDMIMDLCSNQGIKYSRYADDLTFSCNNFDKLKNLIQEVENILKDAGFVLNEKKTRFCTGRHRKIVTGVLLNSDRMTTGRTRKRQVRSALFNYFVKKNNEININKTLGIMAFIRDIEPSYREKIDAYKNKLIKKFALK